MPKGSKRKRTTRRIAVTTNSRFGVAMNGERKLSAGDGFGFVAPQPEVPERTGGWRQARDYYRTIARANRTHNEWGVTVFIGVGGRWRRSAASPRKLFDELSKIGRVEVMVEVLPEDDPDGMADDDGKGRGCDDGKK